MNTNNKPTIKEVAADANVSMSTVSRYINGYKLIHPSTALRIENSIKKLNYIIKPSKIQKELEIKTIFLIVPDIGNPFYSQIAKTVQYISQQNGYITIIYDSQESKNESEAIDVAIHAKVSGILLASIDIKPNIVSKVVESNIPVVGLNAYNNIPFDSVHVHGDEGTYLSTKHLIALGHKRIGFAGGTSNSIIGISRFEGFSKAMKESGLTIDEKQVIQLGFTQTDGYEAGMYFSGLKNIPSAICCANDLIALGLLSALQEKNIRIPEDISVTGMDDVPYAKISNPSLTTVTNNSESFGREAMRMLLDNINGIHYGKPRDIAIFHELIIRNSVRSNYDRE